MSPRRSNIAFAFATAPALLGSVSLVLAFARFRALGTDGAIGLVFGLATCLVGGLISIYVALEWMPVRSRRRWMTIVISAIAIVVPSAFALYPFVAVAVDRHHPR